MSDALRINGNQYSWGSIAVRFGGDRYYGITSISYSDKRERVKAYGMARHQGPRGRSRGKYTPDNVKVTMWKSSAQELRAALAAASTSGESYGDVEFDIVVQYVEGDGNNENPITVEIEGCAWAANNTSEEEGPDPLKEELEFDCMRIRRNGLVLWDSSEGNP
jgi:hypothetical protein